MTETSKGNRVTGQSVGAQGGGSILIRPAVTLCLVPEAAAGPFVFHGNLADGCAWAAQQGFGAVEIFPTHADDLNGRELRDLLNKHELQLAAMGTGAGWVCRQLSLTDPDPHRRMAARDFIAAIVDFAGGFGAPAILGSMQGRVPADLGEEGRPRAFEWLAEALEQLGPRAHALGVPFLYEPLNRYETNLINRVDDAVKFIDGLISKNVKVLLDLFHMNIEEADVADSVRLAGNRVGHVHWADSNRRAMGMGHLDVNPVVEALVSINYKGYVSAEVFPYPDAETAAQTTLASWKRCFGSEVV